MIQDMWAHSAVVAANRCIIEVILPVVHDIEEISFTINVVGPERTPVYAPVIESLVVPAEAGDILFRYLEDLAVALFNNVDLTGTTLFLKDRKQIVTQVANVEGFHSLDLFARMEFSGVYVNN